MKRRPSLRLALPAAIGAGLLIGALAAAGGGDDGYRVRAIFDNASFVIPGEDVRVAGVTVGSIADVDLTSGTGPRWCSRSTIPPSGRSGATRIARSGCSR